MSRASGTNRSTSAMATIIVGAQNKPDTNTATARAATLPTRTNGTVLAAVARTPNSKSLGSDISSLSAPKPRPAISELTAYAVSTMLAIPGCPSDSAKATLPMLIEPPIIPIVTKRRPRAAIPPLNIAEPPSLSAATWMVRKTSGFERWRVIPVSGDICGDGIWISQGSLTLMSVLSG